MECIYKERLDQLLVAIITHIENEIKFTFKKKAGDKLDIIEGLSNLSPHEFGAFGCRATSFANMLEPLEDCFNKNHPDYDKFKSLQTLKEYFEECYECEKKCRNTKEEKNEI